MFFNSASSLNETFFSLVSDYRKFFGYSTDEKTLHFYIFYSFCFPNAIHYTYYHYHTVIEITSKKMNANL